MPEPRPRMSRYEKMNPEDQEYLAEARAYYKGLFGVNKSYGVGLLEARSSHAPDFLIEGSIRTTTGGILELLNSQDASGCALAESYVAEPLQTVTFTKTEQALLNNFKPTDANIDPAQARIQAVMNWFKVLKQHDARGISK